MKHLSWSNGMLFLLLLLLLLLLAGCSGLWLLIGSRPLNQKSLETALDPVGRGTVEAVGMAQLHDLEKVTFFLKVTGDEKFTQGNNGSERIAKSILSRWPWYFSNWVENHPTSMKFPLLRVAAVEAATDVFMNAVFRKTPKSGPGVVRWKEKKAPKFLIGRANLKTNLNF